MALLAVHLKSDRSGFDGTAFDLEGHSAPVTSLAVSEHGLLASSCTKGVVHLWAMRSFPTVAPKCVSSLTMNTGVTRVAMQGSELFASCGDGKLRALDIATGQKWSWTPQGEKSVMNDVTLFHEGMGVVSDRGVMTLYDRRCRCDQTASFATPATSISMDERSVAVGCANGSVMLADLRMLSQWITLGVMQHVVSGVALQGGTLLSTSMDGALVLWNTKPLAFGHRMIKQTNRCITAEVPLRWRASWHESNVFVGDAQGSWMSLDSELTEMSHSPLMHNSCVLDVVATSCLVASGAADGTIAVISR